MTKPQQSIQAKLFPAAEKFTVYEQPLNERMRMLLRLEALFESVGEALERGGPLDARGALAGMIEMSDQLSRVDIKGELIKEIERHAATLNALRLNPGVNQKALEATLGRLEPLLTLLKSNACQPGARLRQSELVTQFKQRLAIPGGTCSFDIPGLHYWLHRDPIQRDAQLQDWMRDMRIIEDAIQTVLRLTRESALPRRLMAGGGFYSQQLDGNAPCQLVRVTVDEESDCYPEISGGKHRFSVRFLRHSDPNARPQLVQEDIWFDLH
ncbi:MAG: cell division protein ZapD, partial [Gammaproteobacteria bacterium]